MATQQDKKLLAVINGWISESGLAPGSRLPPERDLCSTLAISRSELRKALATLEHEGGIIREVGRGTFLAEEIRSDQNESSAQFTELAQRTSPHEAMTARLALEPELASLAAIHATPKQLAGLARIRDSIRGSKNWPEYEKFDAEFHGMIAQASGNVLLEELYRIVNAVRVSVLWKRLEVPPAGPPENYHSFAEHDAIVEALEHRDRMTAHNAMRFHLKSVLSAMIFND